MPKAFDLQRLTITNSPTQRIDYTPGKFPAIDPAAFVDGLINLLKDLTGIDLSSPEAFVTSLIDVVTTGGPALEFAAAILDLLGSFVGIPNLGSFLTQLAGALDGIDITGAGSILAAITTPIQQLINGLLNGGQGVNVLNLFGQLGQGLFGVIPAAAIGSGSPNLLNNGGFDGSISMDGDGVWTWDSAVGHTTLGSARTTADGTLKALLSNAIDVAPNQVLSPSVWVKSSSYTGSGTPIRLGVRTYLDGAAVSTAAVTSSAGPGSTWTQLTGSYTVPSSGVNQVRLRLIVDTTATGGQIWFDDATLTKPGNGPFDGILQLFGLSSLEDLFDGLNVAAIWTAIVNDIINPLGMLFGVGDLIPDSNVPGVTNILDELWGAITGLFTAGRSHSDMTQAVQGQTDAVTNHAAVLSQVVAALSTGTPDADAFERTDSTNLESAWDQYQTGTGAKLATPNGHDAAFSINLLTAGEWVARRNAVFALGDNQVAEMVFATIPATFGANGHNDLWLRMTNFSTFATRTGLCLRYSGDGSLHLYWFASGTPTTLFSGSASLKATAGATLRLEAGVGVTPRRFKAYMNGTPIMDTTEVGTTSQYGVGSGYKYRGFGGKSESVLVNFLPGSLRQWTASG